MARAIAVQRKSEGIVVPVMAAPQNAAGGKGPWGGHDDGSRNDKGMVEARAAGNPSHRRPNSPGRRKSVRYADDFVIVCNTKTDVDEAERRVKMIFQRLHLELHPDKTRKLDLSGGKQGFDFLGCHLHKRMSGRICENERKRVYFLQRWPATKSVKRVKQRVKDLTPIAASHRDLRDRSRRSTR